MGASIIFYRIKQKDVDGNLRYSRILSLQIEKAPGTVVLYGNPVYSEARLTITADQPQRVRIRVIDNTGRVMQSKQLNLSAGSTSLYIEMSGMPKGIYYLDISSNSIKKRISVIKQ